MQKLNEAIDELNTICDQSAGSNFTYPIKRSTVNDIIERLSIAREALNKSLTNERKQAQFSKKRKAKKRNVRTKK